MLTHANYLPALPMNTLRSTTIWICRHILWFKDFMQQSLQTRLQVGVESKCPNYSVYLKSFKYKNICYIFRANHKIFRFYTSGILFSPRRSNSKQSGCQNQINICPPVWTSAADIRSLVTSPRPESETQSWSAPADVTSRLLLLFRI